MLWLILSLLTALAVASQDAWVKKHFSHLSAYDMLALPFFFSSAAVRGSRSVCAGSDFGQNLLLEFCGITAAQLCSFFFVYESDSNLTTFADTALSGLHACIYDFHRVCVFR